MHVIEPSYISPLLILLLFCVGVLVTLLAGTTLSHYADELALRRNLDKGFIGMLFLAGVTSLPELAVCFSALLREPSPGVAIWRSATFLGLICLISSF